MGLISDRKNKAKRDKEASAAAAAVAPIKYPQNYHPAPAGKRGLFGQSVGNGQKALPKYPAGYYTTPVHHTSSWGLGGGGHHPGQPKFQPNVNPRYQTWLAPPRKQPSLGQLVRTREEEIPSRRTLSNTCTAASSLSMTASVYSYGR
jgi:hypothetical protein